MTSARWTVTLLTLAAACSGGSEKPGAVLRGPGALAVFDGIVAHGTGTLRPYLAVANERGDELRLVDTSNNSVVTSPGLVFPLSVPSSGRPLFMAATDLHDDVDATHHTPDALAVIAAGSNAVALVDTWSGHPTVFPDSDPRTVALPADAEVLSMVAAAVPVAVGNGLPVAGLGRILVGLSGGRLAVIDYERDATDLTGKAIAVKGTMILAGLGFDPVSISQGIDAEFVYAASREPLPGGTLGVAELKLTTVPAAPADWTLRELDARAPTEQVAAVRFDGWVAGTEDFTAGVVDRVVAIPVAGGCGEPPRPIRCGLLAIDSSAAGTTPTSGGLAPNYKVGSPTPTDLDGVPYLLPIPIPAPVSGLLATGRVGTTLAVTTGAGTFFTTGLAAVSSDDGRVYLVDLARWTMASDTSQVAGAGRTRVSSAASAGQIGLWDLDLTYVPSGPLDPPNPSAVAAHLPSRIRVTPGFTPDDEWTLTYQGILPSLERRAAVVGRDGSSYWVAVQVGQAVPVADANLSALGVQADPSVDDTVEIQGIESVCPAGVESAIAALIAPDVAPGVPPPGGAAQLAAPGCLTALADGSRTEAVVTFRAGGLVLTGKQFGHADRPAAVTPPTAPTAADELRVPGRRLFYVTDACLVAGSECQTRWTGGTVYDLTFPFPTGPAIGLIPAFVTAPARGANVVFFTASGQTPSGRRPTVKGTVLASELPSGLAMVDPGGPGTGVQVFTSFTAGLVMSFSSAATPGSMAVIR